MSMVTNGEITKFDFSWNIFVQLYSFEKSKLVVNLMDIYM